jgi:hypothetical protein
MNLTTMGCQQPGVSILRLCAATHSREWKGEDGGLRIADGNTLNLKTSNLADKLGRGSPHSPAFARISPHLPALRGGDCAFGKFKVQGFKVRSCTASYWSPYRLISLGTASHRIFYELSHPSPSRAPALWEGHKMRKNCNRVRPHPVPLPLERVKRLPFMLNSGALSAPRLPRATSISLRWSFRMPLRKAGGIFRL